MRFMMSSDTRFLFRHQRDVHVRYSSNFYDDVGPPKIVS